VFYIQEGKAKLTVVTQKGKEAGGSSARFWSALTFWVKPA
jgi:hypothetical protein